MCNKNSTQWVESHTPQRTWCEDKEITRRVWKNELISLRWFSIEHKVINGQELEWMQARWRARLGTFVDRKSREYCVAEFDNQLGGNHSNSPSQKGCSSGCYLMDRCTNSLHPLPAHQAQARLQFTYTRKVRVTVGWWVEWGEIE